LDLNARVAIRVRPRFDVSLSLLLQNRLWSFPLEWTTSVAHAPALSPSVPILLAMAPLIPLSNLSDVTPTRKLGIF